MQTIEKFTVKLPEWSLPYLINGDETGLMEGEIQLIQGWWSGLTVVYPEGSIILNPSGEHYFTRYPIFGLACECVDCDVLIVGGGA